MNSQTQSASEQSNQTPRRHGPLQTRFVKVLYGADRHRKIIKMARMLDISPHEALGLTVSLWLWVDSFRPYGDLPADYDAADVALSIGASDQLDPDDIMKAWVDSGLVDESEAGFVIHNWMEEGRTGFSADKRSRASAKANHTRWHKDRASDDCLFCQMSIRSDPDGFLPDPPAILPTSSSSFRSSSPNGRSNEGEPVEVIHDTASDDPSRPF